MRFVRLLVATAIALALALALAAVAGAQEEVWPTSIPAAEACPPLHASLTAVVDEGAERVYLRLVLENRAGEPAAVPVALEKYPCYRAATLILRHETTSREAPYPGPMKVVFWRDPALGLAPGARQEFPFALTPTWFDQPGTWSVVWRRAVTEADGERLRVLTWEDATERVAFEIPQGFATPADLVVPAADR